MKTIIAIASIFAVFTSAAQLPATVQTCLDIEDEATCLEIAFKYCEDHMQEDPDCQEAMSEILHIYNLDDYDKFLP